MFNRENSTIQIISVLTQVASELEQLKNPQMLTAKEWLSYSEALTKVQEAIAALEKLDDSTPTTNSSPTSEAPKPKKSFMAKLREIEIYGEPDLSQRNEQIL